MDPFDVARRVGHRLNPATLRVELALDFLVVVVVIQLNDADTQQCRAEQDAEKAAAQPGLRIAPLELALLSTERVLLLLLALVAGVCAVFRCEWLRSPILRAIEHLGRIEGVAGARRRRPTHDMIRPRPAVPNLSSSLHFIHSR
eukprot:4236631-Prymnesium_polylepis.1